VEPTGEELAQGVPPELVRFSTARHGAGDYTGFEEWLRARQRWRQTHAQPMPGLFARDRHALASMPGLTPEVISAERAAPTAETEWDPAGRQRPLRQHES
jgi:hypothetical protein